MPAVFGGQSEYFLRPAPLDIFRRKEAREVTTDDFFSFVSFDSLSTGIPIENLPSRIDHEDRVALDSVEDQTIALFTLSERLFCKTACGAVAQGAPSYKSGNKQTDKGSKR